MAWIPVRTLVELRAAVGDGGFVFDDSFDWTVHRSLMHAVSDLWFDPDDPRADEHERADSVMAQLACRVYPLSEGEGELEWRAYEKPRAVGPWSTVETEGE